MDNKTYIIGHKSPDLDSVAAAISYAKFKNELSGTDIYIPATAGPINKETGFILDKLGLARPDELESAEGKKLILVDHNESTQMVNGSENAQIIEVLDHHKLDFKCSEPITINTKPWGASCTIVAQAFLDNNIEIDEKIATLLLSAILVDTVITKSPTCTEYDQKMIEKLSKIAGIDNWQEFGKEIFKVRSDISDLNNMDIIKSDFKDFQFKQGKFGIGQIETADLSQFESREDGLLEEMKRLKDEGMYHSVVLFITDIINIGSKFLVVSSDIENMEKALEKSIKDNKVYLEGIISRKKQVAPMIMGIFDK